MTGPTTIPEAKLFDATVRRVIGSEVEANGTVHMLICSCQTNEVPDLTIDRRTMS